MQPSCTIHQHSKRTHLSPAMKSIWSIREDNIQVLTFRLAQLQKIIICNSFLSPIDGTTDVTRTIHLGTPSKKEIDAFTRVLKGYISLTTAIFPSNAPVRKPILLHFQFPSFMFRILFSNSFHFSMPWHAVHFGMLDWITVMELATELVHI